MYFLHFTFGEFNVYYIVTAVLHQSITITIWHLPAKHQGSLKKKKKKKLYYELCINHAFSVIWSRFSSSTWWTGAEYWIYYIHLRQINCYCFKFSWEFPSKLHSLQASVVLHPRFIYVPFRFLSHFLVVGILGLH